MTFSIRQIGAHPIFHVESTCPTSLAMGFVRMQEYYEGTSKKFRGKVFSLASFRRWYEKKHGDWSYAESWGAFNVPSSAVRMVRDRFPRHSKLEKCIFARLDEAHAFDGRDFYLIGTLKRSRLDLIHELAHALYYFDPEYRRTANAVVRSFDVQPLRSRLRLMGYPNVVHTDEIQAFGLSDWYLLLDKNEKAIAEELSDALEEGLWKYLLPYLTLSPH